MLRTTIETTDPKTGAELPVPVDLRAKVEHAAQILEAILRGVGEKFNIDVRWRFERTVGNDVAVQLFLVAPQGGTAGQVTVTYSFPKEDLRTDESIRRSLWKPIGPFTDILAEEVDRVFDGIRRDLAAFATTAEG